MPHFRGTVHSAGFSHLALEGVRKLEDNAVNLMTQKKQASKCDRLCSTLKCGGRGAAVRIFHNVKNESVTTACRELAVVQTFEISVGIFYISNDRYIEVFRDPPGVQYIRV